MAPLGWNPTAGSPAPACLDALGRGHVATGCTPAPLPNRLRAHRCAARRSFVRGRWCSGLQGEAAGHPLDESGGPVEEVSEPFLHFQRLFWRNRLLHELLVEAVEPFLAAAEQDEVVVGDVEGDLMSEGPKAEGGVLVLGGGGDHAGANGVAVDVANRAQVVHVGVDDAGLVALPPEMAGFPVG